MIRVGDATVSAAEAVSGVRGEFVDISTWQSSEQMVLFLYPVSCRALGEALDWQPEWNWPGRAA